ncbi:PQQ-dependent sugar dehydrogenase [Sediminivirga luteola]|nr:PQQ-dependent sugar dehydrogenase [Sediminivirga luteola]
MRRTAVRTAVPVVAVSLGLAACTPGEGETPDEGATVATTQPAAETPESAIPEEPVVLATGLDVPWSLQRLDEDRTLVSLRDEARIVMLDAEGQQHEVAEVPDAVPGGEGGLLGLAADAEHSTLVAYLTAAEDNRVLVFPMDAHGSGAPRLGEPETIVEGIPKSTTHNGGRIAFGPDGLLYIGTGDAGTPEASQDPESLAGKILRVNPDGSAPEDNPFPDSPVYSLGHRNVQGLDWDAEDRLWASEFGAATWDELNLIEPGGNYGWPQTEGAGGGTEFIDPVHQWATAEASPSGIAVVGDRVLVASLRGERLWSVPVDADAETSEGEDGAEALITGEYGRIRDVVAGPEGSAWLLTGNTDGRGDPGADDDRLIQLPLG